MLRLSDVQTADQKVFNTKHAKNISFIYGRNISVRWVYIYLVRFVTHTH